jgi:hypothetical protein
VSDSDHRRVPTTIAGLPRDKHHRYVPWFVSTETGEPDFRVIRRGGIPEAVNRQLCWVCGTHRGREAAFVIGPMCAINRISAEPPSHRECARYSADVCPFLTTPSMTRRERGLPGDRVDPAGKAIWRNPGVALVWYSRSWKIVYDPNGGALFDVGEPSRVYWRCQGREATRAEVLASIDSGFPILLKQAEEDGGGALDKLQRQHTAAMKLLPGA